jgi:hypothetical protein
MTVLTMLTENESITLLNKDGKLHIQIRNNKTLNLDASLALNSEDADELISWLQIFNNNLKIETK